MQQADTWVIQRCQDLPEEAFLAPETAAEALTTPIVSWRGPLPRVIVLSYPWAFKHHPDPHGFHLRALKKYLISHMRNAFGILWGGPAEGHGKKRGIGNVSNAEIDIGVFWDFASLPQPDAQGNRTPQEQETFSAGLKSINLLYGSECGTTVLQLKELNAIDVKLPTDWIPNQTTYDKRGWCKVEEAISSIRKQGGLLVDLAVGQKDLIVRSSCSPPRPRARKEKAEQLENWDKLGIHHDDPEDFDELIARTTTASMKPPKHPDDMDAMLRNKEETKFTNGSDVDKVSSIYRRFFDLVCNQTLELNFDAPRIATGNWHSELIPVSWSLEQVTCFARALPHFRKCKAVHLGGHVLNKGAVEVLADGLSRMPALEAVSLKKCREDECYLDAEAAQAIFDLGVDRWLDEDCKEELRGIAGIGDE